MISGTPARKKRNTSTCTDFLPWIEANLDVGSWDSKQKEAKCRCPFHHDDKHKFWINRDTGLWKCWDRKCLANRGGSMPQLVQHLRAMRPREARPHLADTDAWRNAKKTGT